MPANLPPALTQLAANINRNSQRLDYLIRDLLDLTRLEKGQVQLQITRVELVRLVTTALASLAPLFQEKNQTLEFEPPAAPYWIEANQHRLEQALVNLLTNANKYTPVGRRIKVEFEPEINQQWINLRIEDSGPGIPLAEQGQIFNRYYPTAEHCTNKARKLPEAAWVCRLLVG